MIGVVKIEDKIYPLLEINSSLGVYSLIIQSTKLLKYKFVVHVKEFNPNENYTLFNCWVKRAAVEEDLIEISFDDMDYTTRKDILGFNDKDLVYIESLRAINKFNL